MDDDDKEKQTETVSRKNNSRLTRKQTLDYTKVFLVFSYEYTGMNSKRAKQNGVLVRKTETLFKGVKKSFTYPSISIKPISPSFSLPVPHIHADADADMSPGSSSVYLSVSFLIIVNTIFKRNGGTKDQERIEKGSENMIFYARTHSLFFYYYFSSVVLFRANLVLDAPKTIDRSMFLWRRAIESKKWRSKITRNNS